MLERWFNRAWYGGVQWTWILLPLMGLYALVANRRRRDYLRQQQKQLPVPVVVVGNITVGGTGKTPVICELARFLTAQGKHVGIISRGYGAAAPYYPFHVQVSSVVRESGDEPLLIAQRGYTVVIDPERLRGARALVAMGVDIILCDDGMQHYALYRDLEICLLDATRMLGNQHLLPVGPLREPASRLSSVDFVWFNGGVDGAAFQIQATALVNLKSRQRVNLAEAQFTDVVAVAGIGNPQRFFTSLQQCVAVAECVAKPDHYEYCAGDFSAYAGRTIIMTEKDAVKCAAFATDNMWFLEVQAVIPSDLLAKFLTRLAEVNNG